MIGLVYPPLLVAIPRQINASTDKQTNAPPYAPHPILASLYHRIPACSLGAALQLRALHLAERGSDVGQVPEHVSVRILWE